MRLYGFILKAHLYLHLCSCICMCCVRFVGAQEAARPWFNNKHALDETAHHPERHSDQVGKYISNPAAASSPTPAAAAAADSKKQPAPAALMGTEAAQYVTVRKRPKLARKGLDLSSWA